MIALIDHYLFLHTVIKFQMFQETHVIDTNQLCYTNCKKRNLFFYFNKNKSKYFTRNTIILVKCKFREQNLVQIFDKNSENNFEIFYTIHII